MRIASTTEGYDYTQYSEDSKGDVAFHGKEALPFRHDFLMQKRPSGQTCSAMPCSHQFG